MNSPPAREGEKDVIVLGEALWDVFPLVAQAPIRTRRREQRCLGGAPANVAVTLARLGLEVGMIALVGDDPLGEGLRDELASAGVDVTNVSRARARTGVTWVELAGKTHTPRYVPFRSPSADMLLDASAIPATLATRFLHVGSSSFATPESAAATRLALSRARASVSIDLNIYRHLWPTTGRIADALADVLATAAVLKASEADLVALGLDELALHALRREHLTIVTRAERGATARWRDLVFEQRPARRTHTVDPIGAGDAFMAGVLAVLARHPKAEPPSLVPHALAFGGRLGARAVTALGATTALARLGHERRALARAPSVR